MQLDLTRDEAYLLFSAAITMVQQLRNDVPEYFPNDVIRQFIDMTNEVGDPTERREHPQGHEATQALIEATRKLVPLAIEPPIAGTAH